MYNASGWPSHHAYSLDIKRLQALFIEVMQTQPTSPDILSPIPNSSGLLHFSSCPYATPSEYLLPIPHPTNLRMPLFFLQLENPIHQRLTRRRATRHIYIHRHNPIASPRHTVTVMIIPTPIRAAAHRDHPSGVGHLVVDLAQGGRHFVGEGAGDDHDIGLAGGSAENNAEAVLVIARSGKVHHFNGTTGEPEGHGPEGTLAGPIGYLVEGCSVGRGGENGVSK